MSDTLLSVVVSVYNQENYISECLTSIIAQNVIGRVEIIVSDDCSTDSSRQIIQGYVDRYPDLIRLLSLVPNQGAAKNYFRGHGQAIGKYVAHMDGDDVMLPGKLQAQIDIMEKNPDCNFVVHAAHYFNDSKSYIAATGFLEPEGVTFFTQEQQAQWPTLSVHSSYMYRNAARKTRIYQRDFMEWYYAMEFLLAAPASKAAFINKVYCLYRFNFDGATYTSSRLGRKKANLILINDLYFYFQKVPSLRKNIYANLFWATVSACVNAREVLWPQIFYLFKKIQYFSLPRIVNSYRVRINISPRQERNTSISR